MHNHFPVHMTPFQSQDFSVCGYAVWYVCCCLETAVDWTSTSPINFQIVMNKIF